MKIRSGYCLDSKSIDRFLEEYGKMVETSKRGERGVIRTFFFLLLSPSFNRAGEKERERKRWRGAEWIPGRCRRREMTLEINPSAGVGGRRAKWVFSVRVCFGLVES